MWHFASVRCDAVMRPELGVKQKCLANARNVENDPSRTFDIVFRRRSNPREKRATDPRDQRNTYVDEAAI